MTWDSSSASAPARELRGLDRFHDRQARRPFRSTQARPALSSASRSGEDSTGRREGGRCLASFVAWTLVGPSGKCCAFPFGNGSPHSPPARRLPHGANALADRMPQSRQDRGQRERASRDGRRPLAALAGHLSCRRHEREHRVDRGPQVTIEISLCEQNAKRFGSAHEGPGRERGQAPLTFPPSRLPVESLRRGSTSPAATRDEASTGRPTHDASPPNEASLCRPRCRGQSGSRLTSVEQSPPDEWASTPIHGQARRQGASPPMNGARRGRRQDDGRVARSDVRA